MNRHDIALIGFGGVARALAETIRDRGDDLARELGFELRVVAITDLRLGSLMVADGIDLDAVLQMPAGETFAGWHGGTAVPQNDYVIRNTTAGSPSTGLVKVASTTMSAVVLRIT